VLVYLDSSAIVKLVQREDESRELLAFLAETSERITSVVATIEVLRAARRTTSSTRALRRADQVLAGLGLVELDVSIRARAAEIDPKALRTLDAIHVATALELGDDITGFITYDERQAHAARRAGLTVSSPGTG
jgi:predicted nucleic acid-binding protein